MSGYDEINRNIAQMIEKGKNSASTSDATYYDEETRRYYSASDIEKLKEINEGKLADIKGLKYYGVSDDDGKITSRKTDIKTNKGVIGRLEGYFGTDEEREVTIREIDEILNNVPDEALDDVVDNIIGAFDNNTNSEVSEGIISDAERETAFNDVMNLINNELVTDDSISYSSSISSFSNETSNDTSETNTLGEGEQQNANPDTIQAAETSEHENNNTNETNSLEEEQQNANPDTIPVAETSEHDNNNNLQRSMTRLQVSDNRNNLYRGDGQHQDTGTLSRRNNVLVVSNSWAESGFYDGPSPAKKDVTKLKKFGNFIKRTFKIK